MSASSSNSSCSPSSSAVTIPIPGKSILKRPPPTQQSLFSRITRFLPTPNQSQPATNGDEAKPLKRAHFILPQIAIVYPISSVNPPSTPTLKEEKRAIEDREAERRKRVLRGNSTGPGIDETEEWWSMDKVESFYRECCAGCEEEPDPAITVALKHASPSNPRTVDLSGVQLTFTSASILSDVFTIEWGLRKLVFRECDLEELTLKPMLHALLIPGTLSFLSVASNRRLKPPAFRLLGAYMKKAKSLQFLDVSQNVLDKKSIEYIVAALATAPEPGLVSLRLDDCALRPAALETLCRAVRTSSLNNISLRHNRIGASGGVALALMIRDYPDVVPASASSMAGTPNSSTTSSPTGSFSNLPSMLSPPGTPTTPQTAPLPSTRAGPPLPPPRHPPLGVQTTYTPYVPRARRGKPGLTPNPLSATGQHIPIITSSPTGGVTTRHPVPGSPAPSQEPGTPRHDAGPSAALLDKVRALDNLPRLGALRTLDLKGNDLRTGITYLAQVLKRNRTLKVLNLSENKLDVQCLVIIAESLKYNSSLETLDLSKNPCSGPGLEGIQSLRTAFTLNTALKRLFLASTLMTSAGAIALAEFLPESTSLLHLDLTNNNLDIAAVMALSSGLKANHTMRCLDLNIPPDDEEFARMCREILNSCVRNTEEAERTSKTGDGASTSSGRGLGKGVWGMIEDSELAKSIRLDEEKKIESDVVVRAHACVSQLTSIVSPSSQTSPSTPNPETVAEVSAKARGVVTELTTVIQETEDPVRLEELLEINDRLMSMLKKVPGGGKPTLTLKGLDPFDESSPKVSGSPGMNGHVNGIAEHDEEDDEEHTPTTPRADKGKQRAEPEPEEPEKVLSPTFLITESESDDEDGSRFLVPPEEMEDVASPTNRSRSWVEEEGEVFRKGQILLGPEEMEGEYAGEDLRKELLEAMVERPPPRPVTDEFGMEVIPGAGDFENTPSTPSATTPVEMKPAPKPYISRSRSSSSSILSIISPVSSPTIPHTESPLQSPASTNVRSPLSPSSPGPTSRPFLSRTRSTSSVETA
ncbi:hypothetical protein BDQ12DRAFT_687045 [Crucibulum laeve]|uniref:RNI-like protein n=1 Tax=Crucibulum laeve TaxID=68775 RepID=A0A5C3LSN6_9AGAR|nr:hypothetical protein BDQ12DRAFT_687045 [Crucibulum laeve]